MASIFKSYGTQNIGTTATTVATAPALTTSTVIGLSCACTGSSIVFVDVTAIKSGVTTYLIKGAPISPGGSLIVIGGDQKVVLEAGNTIQVKSNTATSIDVFVSALEQS
jgi:uncharacterized Zn-binding protein involved in type VI secretion